MEPIVIETVQQYRDHRYSISWVCIPCSLSGEVDLDSLCARGFGDRLMKCYRPKCKRCNRPLQFTVQPPERVGGRPEFLMKKP